MTTKAGSEVFQNEKLKIIKWVTGLKDETALAKLKLLREEPKKVDWWNEVTKEEELAIERGLNDMKAGKVKSHKEVRGTYAKWL